MQPNALKTFPSYFLSHSAKAHFHYTQNHCSALRLAELPHPAKEILKFYLHIKICFLTKVTTINTNEGNSENVQRKSAQKQLMLDKVRCKMFTHHAICFGTESKHFHSKCRLFGNDKIASSNIPIKNTVSRFFVAVSNACRRFVTAMLLRRWLLSRSATSHALG